MYSTRGHVREEQLPRRLRCVASLYEPFGTCETESGEDGDRSLSSFLVEGISLCTVLRAYIFPPQRGHEAHGVAMERRFMRIRNSVRGTVVR
jgi:hypothetical protein